MYGNRRKWQLLSRRRQSDPDLNVICKKVTPVDQDELQHPNQDRNYSLPNDSYHTTPANGPQRINSTGAISTMTHTGTIHKKGSNPVPHKPVTGMSGAVDNVKGNEREIGLKLTKWEMRRRSSEKRDNFFNSEMKIAQKEFESKWHKCPPSSTSLADLSRIVTLGTGTFGTVLLMHNKKDGNNYAVKYLKKQHVVKAKQVQHTLNEKHLLHAINNPFLVNLKFHFKDNCNVYMGLDFVEGGELFTHLRRVGTFSKAQCKFYTAQVILALEYLHYNRIIYRDLKPENIMLTAKGYLKITDFGLAKLTDEKGAWTICGTPEYIAPEILRGKGYNQSVDWWALGILVFEMMGGCTPFYSENQMKIYENILYMQVKYPKTFGKNVKDLLDNLLNRDFTKRFGALAIKNQRWFKNVNFIGLYRGEAAAPFIPRLNGPIDTQYFLNWKEELIPRSTQNVFEDVFEDF